MTIRTLAALSTVALLAACSQPADKSDGNDASAGASASATAGSAAPTGPITRDDVYAAAGQSPEAFVRALYGQYVSGGQQGEPLAPGQDPLYSRTLNALIGADFRAANGEVPTLNYDPVCGCQDQGAFTLDSLAVAQAEPTKADAAVSFTNAGEQKALRLKLVREGVNWKIDDIIDGETSLHDELMKVAEAAG